MKRIISLLLALCCLLAATGSAEAVYAAAGDDESALELTGSEELTLSGVRVEKTGGEASSADAASFRGVNSAVRVADDATLTLRDSAILATAPNATGVFAYDGGTVYIDNCTVEVTGGGAGGVQVAGGGTLVGHDLTVTSASKAAIRSDRGGGTMVLEGGSYTATGKNGCPAIYSTADITVRDADCVSTQSRAVIIEGRNSVTVENCRLEGNDQSTKEGSVRANVLLYQSASGDAKEGTSKFSMTGGELVCNSGAMFYCTNTAAEIELDHVALTGGDSLLIVAAGRWGKDGKNGGRCTLRATDQTLTGDILVDELSSLELDLTASVYTGAITGNAAVILDGESTWTLTGDSAVTSLECAPEQIDLNGFQLTVDGAPFVG